MNLLEILKDTVKPFINNEKPPLHVGEVMNLWFYLTGTEQTLRVDQLAYNTVEDHELRDKLRDIIENVHTPMIKDLTEFLREEGVPLPQSSPQKPIGDYKDLPEGAKMTDDEVANLLAYNLVVGITAATRGLTESVRPDVALMFAKYQVMKISFSVTLKDLMQRRGWVKVPPYYNGSNA